MVVGAAEGGVACRSSAECGVWRQPPGSQEIYWIGATEFRILAAMAAGKIFNFGCDAPCLKLYGYVSPSQAWQCVLYCKKYSKLPKTHPDTDKYIRNKHCSFILYFSGETYYMLLHRKKFRLCAIFLEKVSCWFPHDVFDVFSIVFQARQVWFQPV